ncbi:hypothetical protein TI39_contig4417g00005 [Zymoseptoria brevis]|uniref:Uncharacterized protein n=1 Tax=Zymoseptoria brevis TaxID=1047168 RepID=A0A0F4G7V2_9PEZI|nr:hypothetical protein TI39_contig4417g00005 [Zymoseptoria brevis]
MKPALKVPIRVTDVRSLPEGPSVKKNGYELVHLHSSLPEECFLNHTLPEHKADIDAVYMEECRRLAMEKTGAAEAFPYVFRVRNQSKDLIDVERSDFHSDTVPIVHVDRDPSTAPDRLRSSLGTQRANALMAKYRTMGSINVWRPIKSRVEKWPLMLVDHSSVLDWDYDTHMGRLHFLNDRRAGVRGSKSHETLLTFDPRYRYYYARDMTSDEAWLFYAYHSNTALGVPHSAFWDDKTSSEAATRWSIEVRIWVFFDDERKPESTDMKQGLEI